MPHRDLCSIYLQHAKRAHGESCRQGQIQERLGSSRKELQEKYQCRKGQEGEILILASSQGPDLEETSRGKAKKHKRGSLDYMSFPSFTLENGFQNYQAQQGWETLLRSESDMDQGHEH